MDFEVEQSFAGPAVSVVIPLFQRAHLLERTVSSVLNQTFQDYEIIIVDDGSTDDPASVLERFSDPRIRYFLFENAGVGTARNRGIDLARGKYVAFLDSDDQFLPHHLQEMHNLVIGQEDCIGYTQVIADRGDNIKLLKPPRGLLPNESVAEYLMCGRGFIQTSTIMMKTEIAKGTRYRADTSFGDDTDFAVRLSLAGYRFVMAERPGVIWSDSPDPSRLSASLSDRDRMTWLTELRPRISGRAYRGYLGWHVAKGVGATSPWWACYLYLNAAIRGCYAPRLALLVLAQLLLSDRAYRQLANRWIRAQSMNHHNVERQFEKNPHPLTMKSEKPTPEFDHD